MNLQTTWLAAKRHYEEMHKLNAVFQQVPGIFGCWHPHYENPAFHLWGTWEGEEYDKIFLLWDGGGLPVWRQRDGDSYTSFPFVPLSDKDERLLMKIRETSL
jgi:hypothetical protein